MIYEVPIYPSYSVVVVPFPFTDKNHQKKRPALVLSSIQHQKHTGHISLLMITSAKNSSWHSDHEIKDLESTGLRAASVIRQKIFTIDSRLVMQCIGKLSKHDRGIVEKLTRKHLTLD